MGVRAGKLWSAFTETIVPIVRSIGLCRRPRFAPLLRWAAGPTQLAEAGSGLNPPLMSRTHMQILVWLVAALAIAGVLLRPFHLPEAVWAAAGAMALVLLRLLPWPAALDAVARGNDVYLFLAGMMLLSEIARREGVFEWVARLAVHAARGSPRRLFALVYGVGIVVTAILSNDATAVVLTPAVFATARRARADALPFLFICAMVANAASFVFPISNPANLVVYDGNVPPLGAWLARFALPSLLAIAATYALLRLVFRSRLRGACAVEVQRAPLSPAGKIGLAGIIGTAIVLLAASALHFALGLPTALCGGASLIAIWAARRQFPAAALRGIAWSVLPLVAGLFVLADAVDRTTLASTLASWLHAAPSPLQAAAASGAGIAPCEQPDQQLAGRPACEPRRWPMRTSGRASPIAFYWASILARTFR